MQNAITNGEKIKAKIDKSGRPYYELTCASCGKYIKFISKKDLIIKEPDNNLIKDEPDNNLIKVNKENLKHIQAYLENNKNGNKEHNQRIIDSINQWKLNK